MEPVTENPENVKDPLPIGQVEPFIPTPPHGTGMPAPESVSPVPSPAGVGRRGSKTERHSTKNGHLPKPDRCLNCGEPTGGNFCANCGQENEHQTVAVKLLIGDLLSDLASFDSRLVRTLVPLLFRPGFLTNEYNIGRRVRYLSPFKLYLTMSVLFFVLLPITHRDTLMHVTSRPTVSGKDRQSLNEANDDLRQSPVHVNIGTVPSTEHGIFFQNVDVSSLPKTVAEYDARQRDPRLPHDRPAKQYLVRQLIKVKQSPQALLQALLDYIPRIMFVLLPCFALSLKLMYLRSNRLYIEHLIFALHLHAFFFLILSSMLLLRTPQFEVAAAIALSVYPLIAMRVVYKQGWIKTAVKYSLLAFNYTFLLTFGFLAAIAVAFLMV